MSEVDVIIVGAGAAGLSAAKELDRLGLSYSLVEASERIGGRAFSQEIAPGEWFDHGCAWLVGGEDNPFTQIARERGIALSTDKREWFQLERLRFVKDGVALTPAERDACIVYHMACDAAIAAAAAQGRDVPISDVIPKDNGFAQPFVTMIETSWGKTLDQVSTLDNESCVGDLGYQALQGYGSLVAHWGADVPVSLNTCVDRIAWSQEAVTVETNNGTLKGRTVLLTVSTGVLGSERLAFHPRLPVWKQEAIHALPMGTENKIGVAFDRDVFGEDGRAYYTTWLGSGPSAKLDASVMGLNTAVVLVGGALGLDLEKAGPRALQSFAMDRLVDLFGSALRDRVVTCLTTAWNSNPLTHGSWAATRPGQAHQREQLARPVENRLFFAGEATMVGPQGTCHGAYQSGKRAAAEIAQCLKRVEPGSRPLSPVDAVCPDE